MKKKLLNLMMLLVALLMGGAVQAAVETYDFDAFVAGGVPNLTLTSTAVEQQGSNSKTVYVVGEQTNTNKTVTLDMSRIALCTHAKSGTQMKWIWRVDKKNKYKNGLGGTWDQKGTAVTSYNISILNLNKGDNVTITYSIGNGKAAQLHACSGNMLSTDGTEATALKAEEIVVSGTTYTVLSDGNLDMYDTNNNMAINKIVIESDKIDESIEAPLISVVGANSGDRIIAINANKTNNGNATTTYYTTDGTDPTTSSKVYNGNITITSTEAIDGKVTIKAITVKTGDENVKSDIVSFELSGVGTTLKLNAPTINVDFKQSGDNYIPVYSFTSNQDEVVGKPSVSYSYKINETTGETTSYDATETGTLTVTVSAEGYESATSSIGVKNVLFNQEYSYDFTTLTEHSDTKVSDNMTSLNGEGCYAYSLASDAFEGITLNGMSQLWAITAGKTQGLYARTGEGTIKYNGNFPEGSYVMFANLGTPVASTDVTTSFAQYGYVKSMAVYTPAITISLNTDYTYSTYCPTSDLDFTNVEGVEVYKAQVSGDKVVTTKVEGKVKAGEGIIIKNVNKVASVTVPTTTGAEELAGNELVGAQEAISDWTDKNAYMLVCNDGVYQFQKIGSGTLKAGKAYLSVSTDASVKPNTLFFGENNATAINGVAEKAEAQNAAIYNMQGIKVEKAEKGGLYIINGKKYIK